MEQGTLRGSWAHYVGAGYITWELGTLCGSRTHYVRAGNITLEQGNVHEKEAGHIA